MTASAAVLIKFPDMQQKDVPKFRCIYGIETEIAVLLPTTELLKTYRSIHLGNYNPLFYT